MQEWLFRLLNPRIDFNVDYKKLCLYESAFMHEVKDIGPQAFCKRYASKVNNVCSKDPVLRLLAALLAYFGEETSFSVPDGTKYIVDNINLELCRVCGTKLSLSHEMEKALPVFRKYRILYAEVKEAV